MEIERKWLVAGWPEGAVPSHTYRMDQGYIALSPTVRIRREAEGGVVRHVLCFKGKADAAGLAREEIETEILPRLGMFRSWLSAVEEYTLRQALEGTEYKGFKVVEGRSVRKFGDPAGASLVLQEAGYDRETICTQPELKSVSALEKIIGKKRFAELCGPFVVRPPGKPALVPDDDKRPAFKAAADDFKDFRDNPGG